MSCDDVNARLVDLVYGDGDADELGALQAHVEGCARCRADLDALGRTRAEVRVALDDEPPPLIHAALLRAAAEAVVPVPVVAAAAARAPVAARPRASSFWAELRRRWTWPTLATVGAVAIIVLASRAFLTSPEKALERGRQGVFGEAREAPAIAAPVPTPPAERREAPEPPVSAAAPSDLLRANAERHHHGAAHSASGGSAQGKTKALAAPAGEYKPAESKRANVRVFEDEGGLMEKDAAKAKTPAPVSAPARARLRDKADQGDNSLDGLGDLDLPRSPPAPKEEQAPAAAEKPLSRSANANANANVMKKGGTGISGAAIAAPAPAAAPGPAAASSAPPPTPPEVVALSRRADELFTEGRWAEAMAIYDDLLRRFPDAVEAPRWRSRVYASRRAAKAPANADRKAADQTLEAAPAAPPPAATQNRH
jgi:hypothetical protein